MSRDVADNGVRACVAAGLRKHDAIARRPDGAGGCFGDKPRSIDDYSIAMGVFDHLNDMPFRGQRDRMPMAHGRVMSDGTKKHAVPMVRRVGLSGTREVGGMGLAHDQQGRRDHQDHLAWRMVIHPDGSFDMIGRLRGRSEPVLRLFI
jgi:hypothetical protein